MGPYDTMKLAIAVTNAGGFGMVSHPEPGEEAVAHLISGEIKPEEAFESVKQELRETIETVKEEANGHLGLNFRVAPEQPEVPELLDMVIEMRNSDNELREKLIFLLTSAGDPSQVHLKKIKENGMLWFHNVPSAYHAQKAQKAGVDGLIATGYEAGGHVAYHPVHTMVLVPAVTEKASVPVLAGGGICDGKGLVATLSLGAVGIYMGTRFIVTEESDFSQRSKKAIVSSGERYEKVTATLVTEGSLPDQWFVDI